MAGKTEKEYHDFTKESETENFKLIVEEQNLFIDLNMMAKSSGYFEKIQLGDSYKENQEMQISIPDVTFDDIHQMLQCLGPKPQRPITGR